MPRRLRIVPIILSLLIMVPALVSAEEGKELLGTPAPEWEIAAWIQSEPLTLAQLAGSVVLVRFWTDTCPYCAASAPILSSLHERYARDGLVVIGIYHPKPPRRVDPAVVQHAAALLDMSFPIGLDYDWATVKRYWLDGAERSWTSSSFLIDRRGFIRYIHPGGSYSEEEARALEEAVTLLLGRVG